MFTEIRNAINAAEWILSNLEWAEKNLMSSIDENNERRKTGDFSEWDKEEAAELACKLDALNAVKKCLTKFVKDSQ